MENKKTDWKMIILLIWAIFSFLFIAWNLYQSFKYNVMQNAYMTWQNETINKLIEQAKNKECKPFNVYSWENKVDLINLECLQKAPAWETNNKEVK